MQKIPKNKQIEIYEKANFIDSPLVKITPDTGIIVDMQYPKLGMKESINECLVRKEILERLLEAKKNLPEGYTFKIWDAYRPFALQKELYRKYKHKIIKEFNLKNMSKEKQEDIIKNYVSLPNENIPPLHTTGGSVDLTIVDLKTGNEIDMGVHFDEFSEKTSSDAYEKEGMNETIRKNRRILYNSMIKAGFTNLPSEIWHYDYGNRAWAFYTKKPAIYKGLSDLE